MVIRYARGISTLESWMRPPHTRAVRVHVFWGASGTGKTHTVMMRHPNCFVMMPPSPRAWFDGYLEQDVVLFDDFRTDWFSQSFLLKLLDKWPMRVEIKGGTVAWTPTDIYITTDADPETWFDGTMHAQLMRRIHTTTRFTDEDVHIPSS